MPKLRKAAARFSLVFSILYVATLIALVNLEDRLVYPGAYMPPSRAQPPSIATLEASVSPSKSAGEKTHSEQVNPQSSDAAKTLANNSKNLSPELITDVSYRTCDGLLLWGRLLEVNRPDDSGPENTVLVLHGNANRAVYLNKRLVRLANYLDANVMAAEYRGFEDDHQPSEKGLQKDCEAAMDFLCQRYNLSSSDIIIFGTSLGGGCATSLAASRGAKVVILDRTFDRLFEVAAEKYPFFPVRSIMKNRYDSIQNLQIYRGPLIMIHGDQDEIVSIERGRNLYEQAACSPKHWIEVPGLSHLMPLADETLEKVRRKTLEIKNAAPPLPRIDTTIPSDFQAFESTPEMNMKLMINVDKDDEAGSSRKKELPKTGD